MMILQFNNDKGNGMIWGLRPGWAERGKRGGEGKWVVESTLWSVDYSIISADNKSQETRVASGGGWCVRNSTTGGNNERNY